MKDHSGFALIELFIICLVVVILSATGFLIYKHQKTSSNSNLQQSTSSNKKSDSTTSNDFKLPSMPSGYRLVNQTAPKDDPLPDKEYITDDTDSEALATAKTICNASRFNSQSESKGDESYNGSPNIPVTTLHCSKDDVVWQFDIEPAWTLKYKTDYKEGKVKFSDSETLVTIQSMPKLCSCPLNGPCNCD